MEYKNTHALITRTSYDQVLLCGNPNCLGLKERNRFRHVGIDQVVVILICVQEGRIITAVPATCIRHTTGFLRPLFLKFDGCIYRK